MLKLIYLDYNATAPLRPQVIERMSELMAAPSNASSVHSYGRAAKKTLEDARKTIAEAISAFPNEVVFCASGTEANNWALSSQPTRQVLVSAVEHSSILKRHPGAGRDDNIAVSSDGIIDLNALSAMLSENMLVSVMLANNETGVIQPIQEIAALCKQRGALLHCDAVQALGKIPLDFTHLGVDMMTISAHKMGGPLGAAALIVRQNLATQPLLMGGGQELGRRAGTENIPAIAGFAQAVELIDLAHMQQLRAWLNELEEGAITFGKEAPRLPNTSCIAMPGVSSEVQLMNFDLQHIAISAGSACSSGRIEPSHVLLAMGVDKALAGNAIRVSGGWGTKKAEIDQFKDAWNVLKNRMKTS